MKHKVCGDHFTIDEDEDVDLNFGTLTYDDVKHCPVCGNSLAESEVEPSNDETTL